MGVRINEKFAYNSGKVEKNDNEIEVKMKKKRGLPALLTVMEQNMKIKL